MDVQDSKADDVEWCRHTTLALIKIYERHPCLWRESNPSYKNRFERQKALLNITRKLKTKNKKITVDSIRKKIHNLRSQFTREVKFLKRGNQDGNKAAKFWAFDHLRFLSQEIDSEDFRLYSPSSDPTLLPEDVEALDMGDGFLSLCWNNHRSTFCHVISTLREKERYSDVTLACEGRFYPVHKLVLSVCSEYFDAMLERTPCKHPIIVLRDVQPDDLELLLSYMYQGIVNVPQNDLGRLMKTAEALRIKGLAVPDDPIVTPIGHRISGVSTAAIPIITTTIPKQNREARFSPHPKRKRREANGENTELITQAYGEPATDEAGNSPKLRECLEGRHRTARLEIRQDVFSSKEIPQAEIVVSDSLVKEELDETDLPKQATLISAYSVVASDGSTHIVSHPGDHNQVVAHRFEAAQVVPATHQAASQPLAEAVAEALAGPSGMQTWLSGAELGPASFTAVETFAAAAEEAEIHTTPPTHTLAPAQNLEQSQTATVNVVVTSVTPVATTSSLALPVSMPNTTTSCETAGGTGGNTTGRTENNTLKCHFCNRATFRQTSDLRRHIRIHTGEKPFKCSFCPYKASRKDLLQAHSHKMHNNTQ